MSEERSLVDIMAIARRRWLLVAAPILLLIVLANWYTGRQDLRYEATARVVLTEDASTRLLDPGSQNPGYLAREIENQIALAYGSEVSALVALELGELPELAVSHNPESDILLFQAEGPTAEEAARAANTWAEIFVAVRQERVIASIAGATESLEARLDTLRAEQATIRAPLDSIRRLIRSTDDPDEALKLQQDYDLLADDLRYELDLNTSEAQSTVDDLSRLRLQSELASAEQNLIAEPAEPPDDPANTPLSRILVIAVIAGAVAGLGLAVLADGRDRTIRSVADLQDLTDLPVLAAVPRAKWSERSSIGRATVENPTGTQADSYHQIRSALEFEMHEKPLYSVMVTSPVRADGRSTVAANLALALGSVGVRTALVDSDYRSGSLHRVFGINREPGLSNLVRREIEASRVARSLPGDESEDLVILPSGTIPPNPAAFVASPRFLTTLQWMGTQAEMVVVDTPPVIGIPETHTIGRQVDGAILVIRAKRTTADELEDALAVLDQINARVIGIVLLGVRRSRQTVKQIIRTRRQAAVHLPPVLNVGEGPRTADYRTLETVNANPSGDHGTNTISRGLKPVADLGAGLSASAAVNGTETTESGLNNPGRADDTEQTTETALNGNGNGHEVPTSASDDLEIAEVELDPSLETVEPAELGVETEVLTDADFEAAVGSEIETITVTEAAFEAELEAETVDSSNGFEEVTGQTRDDWFQDRSSADTNGHAGSGNGHDPSSNGAAAAENADQTIETADGTTDGPDGEPYLVDPGELALEFDEGIVDLAELDDGLVE